MKQKKSDNEIVPGAYFATYEMLRAFKLEEKYSHLDDVGLIHVIDSLVIKEQKRRIEHVASEIKILASELDVLRWLLVSFEHDTQDDFYVDGKTE